MIESGSLTPGVSAASFGLPPNTALRYEQPDAALTGYVSDYHVLDSEGPDAMGAVEWMLPSWPAIRIILSENAISLRLGETLYDPMPVAALYGTTTRAMRITTSGGVTIGAGITPLGWSRLFDAPCEAYRDRIVPLHQLLDAQEVSALVSTLAASDRSLQVKGILDRFFLRIMGPVSRDEPEIRQLQALIADPSTRDLNTAAAELGIHPVRLRRLSKRYFGYAPKTLLSRHRFLQSLLKMFAAGPQADYALIGDGYFDASHFLRDGKRFLGMTPRQFMQMPMAYLRACLRARAIVLGAATQVLDPVETEIERPATEAAQ